MLPGVAEIRVVRPAGRAAPSVLATVPATASTPAIPVASTAIRRRLGPVPLLASPLAPWAASRASGPRIQPGVCTVRSLSTRAFR